MRFGKQGQKKEQKRVFAVGEKVCFFILDPKTYDRVWHMGMVETILPVKNTDEQKARVAPFELVDKMFKSRAIEDWETDAPPNFAMPREVLILDRLLSETKWPEKKLSTVEVELRNLCIARHAAFLNFYRAARNAWQR